MTRRILSGFLAQLALALALTQAFCSDPTSLATTDLLVRSLLLRPDQPAVILLGHFSPQIQGEHGYAGPEVWHSAVAQFYDVVHLS